MTPQIQKVFYMSLIIKMELVIFFDRHIVKNQYTIIQSDPVYLHCINISLLWLQNTFNYNLGLAHFPLGLGPKRANGILCGPL